MGIFRRKTIEEIEQDYADAHIKSDALQFYRIAKDKTMKREEKAKKMQDKLDNVKKSGAREDTTIDDIERKIGAITDKKKIRMALSRIPILGRVPELIGDFGNLPIINRIPLVRELGEVGKNGREYRRLRKQLSLAKRRRRVLTRNEKNLTSVVNKYTKDFEKADRALGKCKKTLRRTYKIEKSNIEISKLYEEKKKLLELVYDENSMAYISNYVETIRNGDVPGKLPEDVANAGDMLKKLEKALDNKSKGKTAEALKVEDQFVVVDSQDNTNNRNSIPQGTFSKMGLDIKRDYVKVTLNIDGQSIELSPEETLAYVGMMEDYSDSKDVIKMIRDGQIRLEEKEELGWNHLKQMIDIMKNPIKKIEYQKLSDYGKQVYNVANMYMKNEQNALQAQATQQQTQQTTRN